MSTACHPETDGQTESTNPVIDTYLRSYCDYEQNDWAEMLPMTEYAYNNSKHSSTKISPFCALYGYEPKTNWPTKVDFNNPASEIFGHYVTGVHKTLSENLDKARELMGKYYNKKRGTIEDFNKGELVMLERKEYKSKTLMQESRRQDVWTVSGTLGPPQ